MGDEDFAALAAAGREAGGGARAGGRALEGGLADEVTDAVRGVGMVKGQTRCARDTETRADAYANKYLRTEFFFSGPLIPVCAITTTLLDRSLCRSLLKLW